MIVWLLLLMGCPLDGNPARVGCSDDEHCPPGWACDGAVGRCVEALDDVQNVYANFELSDEEMQRLAGS